eukprot:Clim_evm116s152 gene=Clim_evmTU116s152
MTRGNRSNPNATDYGYRHRNGYGMPQAVSRSDTRSSGSNAHRSTADTQSFKRRPKNPAHWFIYERRAPISERVEWLISALKTASSDDDSTKGHLRTVRNIIRMAQRHYNSINYYATIGRGFRFQNKELNYGLIPNNEESITALELTVEVPQDVRTVRFYMIEEPFSQRQGIDVVGQLYFELYENQIALIENASALGHVREASERDSEEEGDGSSRPPWKATTLYTVRLDPQESVVLDNGNVKVTLECQAKYSPSGNPGAKEHDLMRNEVVGKTGWICCLLGPTVAYPAESVIVLPVRGTVCPPGMQSQFNPRARPFIPQWMIDLDFVPPHQVYTTPYIPGTLGDLVTLVRAQPQNRGVLDIRAEKHVRIAGHMRNALGPYKWFNNYLSADQNLGDCDPSTQMLVRNSLLLISEERKKQADMFRLFGQRGILLKAVRSSHRRQQRDRKQQPLCLAKAVVPGVIESKPPVRRGDTIEVRFHAMYWAKFQCVVMNVDRVGGEVTICLQWEAEGLLLPVPGQGASKCNLHFTLNNSADWLMLSALHRLWEMAHSDPELEEWEDFQGSSVSSFRIDNYVYPVKLPQVDRDADANHVESAVHLKTYDPTLNLEQKQAVHRTSKGWANGRPFLVFGPPGTGKTKTLVEIILNQFMGEATKRVYATGQEREEDEKRLRKISDDYPNGESMVNVESGALPADYDLPHRRNVLVVAPSDQAADVLTARLARHLGPAHMLRLCSPQRGLSETPISLQRYCLIDPEDASFRLPRMSDLVIDRKDVGQEKHTIRPCALKVVVTTCLASAMLHGMVSEQKKNNTDRASGKRLRGMPGLFDVLCMDEAGQATEPESLVPFAMLRPNAAVVLAGDPKQLGPPIRSRFARKHGYDVSLMGRLMLRYHCYAVISDNVLSDANAAAEGTPTEGSDMQNPQGDLWQRATTEAAKLNLNIGSGIVMLKRNYRSHMELLHVPSHLFYHDELLPFGDIRETDSFLGWEHLPNRNIPLMFAPVFGLDLQEADFATSFYNPAEIVRTANMCRLIVDSGRAKQTDIAVICPFRSHVRRLRTMLRADGLAGVDVGIVEDYQGQERRVTVLNTVRTSRSSLGLDLTQGVGLVNQPRRFNVAITRSKGLLVIVGDPDFLLTDLRWKTVLTFAVRNGCVVRHGDQDRLHEQVEYGREDKISRRSTSAIADTWMSRAVLGSQLDVLFPSEYKLREGMTMAEDSTKALGSLLEKHLTLDDNGLHFIQMPEDDDEYYWQDHDEDEEAEEEFGMDYDYDVAGNHGDPRAIFTAQELPSDPDHLEDLQWTSLL